MKLATFGLIVRWILTVVLLVQVYLETGVWTVITLSLVFLAIEMQSLAFRLTSRSLNNVSSMIQTYTERRQNGKNTQPSPSNDTGKG